MRAKGARRTCERTRGLALSVTLISTMSPPFVPTRSASVTQHTARTDRDGYPMDDVLRLIVVMGVNDGSHSRTVPSCNHHASSGGAQDMGAGGGGGSTALDGRIGSTLEPVANPSALLAMAKTAPWEHHGIGHEWSL